MARYSPGQAGLVQSSPNIFSAFLLVWSSPSFLDRLCSVRGVLQSTDVWRPDCFSSNSINFFSTEKAGNDSNLLIVFYVQIMPDDFVMQLDRKSTRLNSSHVSISYAVFCLKKKKIITII